MALVTQRLCEFIFCILGIIICFLDVLNNDFGEVDEAIFQGVERTYELIFFILSIEKSDLDEVA
jgi:hypothetical protein